MSSHENKLSICFLLLFYLLYGAQSKGSIWHAVCVNDVKFEPKWRMSVTLSLVLFTF